MMNKIASWIFLTAIMVTQITNQQTKTTGCNAFIMSEDDIYLSANTPVYDIECVTEDEINMIAMIVIAEAEGESETGKRLVVDTVLNRMLSSDFPDTIESVIYQNNAFSPIKSGRAEKCKNKITDEIIKLVRSEIVKRTNTEVLYFRTNNYSKYGTPLFKEGNHYFSGK